jgi:hypothetical protein
MAEQGLENNGLHHEIDLCDVAETDTEKMPTIAPTRSCGLNGLSVGS